MVQIPRTRQLRAEGNSRSDSPNSSKLERTVAYLDKTNPGVMDCSPRESLLSSLEAEPQFNLEHVQQHLPRLPVSSFSQNYQDVQNVGNISSDPLEVDGESRPLESRPLESCELFEIPFKATILPENMKDMVIDTFEEVCVCNPSLLPNLQELIRYNAKREVTVFKPTPIQRHMIALLNHKDNVMANAPTGSGKTLAFALPAVIQALLRKAQSPMKKFGPHTLILCGTREVSIQHFGCVQRLARNTPVTVSCIVGGTYIRPDGQELRKDILCISPGKLWEMLEKKDHNGIPSLNLADLQMIIVDEADEFFNYGKFRSEREALKESLKRIREKCQMNGNHYEYPTLALISATLEFNDPRMTKATEELLGEDRALTVQFTFVLIESEIRVEQRVIQVNTVLQKLLILTQLMDRELAANGVSKQDRPSKYKSTCFIFVHQRNTAFFLTAYLTSKGYSVRPLTGTMIQSDRNTTIKMLKESTIPFVVATNLGARGIDIPSVSHVINYELPDTDFEQYKHRVGRTGRAGEVGISTLLFDVSRPEDVKHGKELLWCLIEKKQIVPRFLWNMFGQEFIEKGFREVDAQNKSLPASMSADIVPNVKQSALFSNSCFLDWNERNNDDIVPSVDYSSETDIEEVPYFNCGDRENTDRDDSGDTDIEAMQARMDNTEVTLYSEEDNTDVET